MGCARARDVERKLAVALALLALACGPESPGPSHASTRARAAPARPTPPTPRASATAPTASAPDAVATSAFEDAPCRRAIAARFRPLEAWSAAIRGPTKCEWPTESVSHCDWPVPKEGWAGSSFYQTRFAWALSDDGLTMARCNVSCTVLRVTNGQVLARAKSIASFDGTSPTALAENAPLLKQYGLNSGAQSWPLPDAFVDFSEGEHSVTYYLRDRKSAARVAVGRFARAGQLLTPEDWMVSTNGRTLLLRALVQAPIGMAQSYDDAVVDLPAAVARLYVEAAAETPRSAALQTRARAACAALR